MIESFPMPLFAILLYTVGHKIASFSPQSTFFANLAVTGAQVALRMSMRAQTVMGTLSSFSSMWVRADGFGSSAGS